MRRHKEAIEIADCGLRIADCSVRKLLVAVVPALLLVSGCGHKPDAAATTSSAVAPTEAAATPAPEGSWVQVRRETIRQYAPAVGTLRSRQSTQLGPQVSGQVEEVLVDVGDRVKAGQVLVRIDPTLFEIEVQQFQAAVETARGALASAEADVQFAQREVPRQLELFNRNAASPKEKDDATTAYERVIGTRDEKKGELGEAQQRLRYGQRQLDETQIRAPYDGTITRRMVDPGQPASANPVTNLVEVQETGVLYLEFSLPQELLATIAPGTPITFEVEGAAEGQGSGEVAVVFPAIDEATRSFRCRVIVPNADLRLRPGLLAQVHVLTRQVANALVVPRRALSQTASGWQVLASGPAGPTARAVQVGLLTDEVAEITGGLQESDRVLLPPDVGR